jgi:UDP-N-acetylglucosamine 1-carboxyvinyltransferase
VLLNANTRVENQELARLLNAMGADIEVSKRVVRVRGVGSLPGGAHFEVMPGWDEAVTYMTAAAITGGEVRIKGVPLDHVWWDVVYLRLAGVSVFQWASDLFVAREGALKPFDLLTGPAPCLNSDMQPVFAALAAFCEGPTTLTDNRFKQRFQYVEPLRAFGVPIHVFGNSALIEGGGALTPAQVRAPDLRGGAALALTALGIAGESRITNAYQVFRGYARFDEKLRALGADVVLEADG